MLELFWRAYPEIADPRQSGAGGAGLLYRALRRWGSERRLRLVAPNDGLTLAWRLTSSPWRRRARTACRRPSWLYALR